MNPDSLSTQNKLLVFLYSDPNFLAVSVLENLLSKNCLVNIFTDDVKGWKEKTGNLSSKNRFSIFDDINILSKQNYSYAVYCGGFIEKSKAYGGLKYFMKIREYFSAKSLAILPFEVFDQKENSSISIKDNVGVIYLGDLLGAGLDLNSQLLISESLNGIIQERNLVLPVGEVYYPIFIGDAVRVLTKWLFSFGPYGHETFLMGSQISATAFFEINRKLIPDIHLVYDDNLTARVLPRGFEVKTQTSDLSFSLKETYKWINSILVKGGSLSKKRRHFEPAKPKKVYPKFLKPLLIFLSTIFLLPFLTLLAALMFFAICLKEFSGGKDTAATNLVLIAKTFSVASKDESYLLSYIPLLNYVYKETAFAGAVGESSSNITLQAIPLIRSSAKLLDSVLGDAIYDPTPFSQEIKAYLSSIYFDLSSLQVEEQNANNKNIFLARALLAKVDLERIRSLALEGQTLADNLPSILGKGQTKTYLVLFQNNMEIRPTGGFIGSYGLMSFDGGRMSNLAVSDVYSADGQLNGHVEPPSPIKNYLGEANWWLRDSNWDPDFTTSAKRAEWFLDKEVGREVNGVMAVDLEPIKNILKYTGPVFLPDFNLDITSDNLYEKTQSEVQDNFFPGTHKKASFLTALSRNLLSEVGKLTSKSKLYILKVIYGSLEGRHIQLYLHDQSSQDAIDALRWDGGVVNPDCGETCYPDLVGVVEANLGVNKANYFITRKTNLAVHITPNEIDRRLTLNLKNSGNPALGLSGKYKTYIRLLIPTDSQIVSIKDIYGQNVENLSPEITTVNGRTEAGVLVEVLGGQERSIEFNWKSVLAKDSSTNKYDLFIRKQAGIEDNPISITVDNGGRPIHTIPSFALTKAGQYVYNTNLVRDFYSHIVY